MIVEHDPLEMQRRPAFKGLSSPVSIAPDQTIQFRYPQENFKLARRGIPLFSYAQPRAAHYGSSEQIFSAYPADFGGTENPRPDQQATLAFAGVLLDDYPESQRENLPYAPMRVVSQIYGIASVYFEFRNVQARRSAKYGDCVAMIFSSDGVSLAIFPAATGKIARSAVAAADAVVSGAETPTNAEAYANSGYLKIGTFLKARDEHEVQLVLTPFEPFVKFA